VTFDLTHHAPRIAKCAIRLLALFKQASFAFCHLLLLVENSSTSNKFRLLFWESEIDSKAETQGWIEALIEVHQLVGMRAFKCLNV